MTVGGILGETWRVYRTHLGRFVLVTALVFAVLNFATQLLLELFVDPDETRKVIRGEAEGSELLETIAPLAATLVVLLIGTYLVQAVLVDTTRDALAGRPGSSVAEAFRRAAPALPALIGAAVLAALGILAGLFLFVIPAVFLAVRWAIVAPVVVVERRGPTGSLGRSWDLVRGHSWTVLAILLVSYVAVGLVGAIVGGIVAAPFDDFFGRWLGQVVADSLVVPFLAIALTLVYLRLEERERVAAATS